MKRSKPPVRDADPDPDAAMWNCLCVLVQHIFLKQEIPTELSCQFLELLPKPDSGVRGIGLLEIVWKIVEALIDTRIKFSVHLHEMIHGFRAG